MAPAASALTLGAALHPPVSSLQSLTAACSLSQAATSRAAKKARPQRSLRAMSAEAYQLAAKEGAGHEAEWAWPPESDGWVLSHNALRLDLEDFSRLLAALEAQLAAGRPVEAWQAAAIRRYWEQAVHMLVVHHDSEEELYFPLMRTKFAVEEKQTGDHVEIVRQVEKCTDELQALLEAKGAAEQQGKLRTLQADFSRFSKLCLQHFQEEEGVTLGQLRHHFSPAEVLPVAKRISKMYSLFDMGNYLRPMTHEERVAWMTRVRMPFFVQWLMLLQCWRYDRDVMRPFEAAIKGEKPAGWSLL